MINSKENNMRPIWMQILRAVMLVPLIIFIGGVLIMGFIITANIIIDLPVKFLTVVGITAALIAGGFIYGYILSLLSPDENPGDFIRS